MKNIKKTPEDLVDILILSSLIGIGICLIVIIADMIFGPINQVRPKQDWVIVAIAIGTIWFIVVGDWLFRTIGKKRD